MLEVEEVAIILVQALLKLLGPDKAKALLDQEAINRANAIADAVEDARGLP